MARGDHIFIYSLGYSHHGIDCGDGQVVHFDSNPWRKLAGMVSPSRAPRICKVARTEFALGRTVFVRPYPQNDDPDAVLRRALSRLDEECYHLFHNNCEHFAVWCKTGQSESTQVQAIKEASRSLGKTTSVGFVTWRVARYLPPPLRPWALGAAAATAGVSAAVRYWKFRRACIESGKS